MNRRKLTLAEEFNSGLLDRRIEREMSQSALYRAALLVLRPCKEVAAVILHEASYWLRRGIWYWVQGRRRRLLCRLSGHVWMWAEHPDPCVDAHDEQFRPLFFRCGRCLAVGRLGPPSIVPLDKQVPSYGRNAYEVARLSGRDQKAAIRAYFQATSGALKVCLPNPERVKRIIKSEEEQAHALIKSIRPEIKRLNITKDTMTAMELARLWDERGWDPELVCIIIGWQCPPLDYMRELVQRRQAQRAG